MPMNILALSIHDLRYPIHGSARFQLSTLGSIALAGGRVIYMAPDAHTSAANIYLRSRYGSSSFTMIKAQIRNYELDAPRIAQLLREINFEPDILLCFDRRQIILCRTISKTLKIPLVLIMDSVRYLHYRELLAINAGPTFALLTPLGIGFYYITTLMSNHTICVSRYIEEKLRKITNKVTTIEPTFMLLDSKSDALPPHNIDDVPENSVLLSTPLNIATYIILKLRDVNFVITGPAAYNMKIHLKQIGLETRLNNLFLLHNINDRDLEKIHTKITLAVIARPALTGFSVTFIQEMYFRKPTITDQNVASKVEGSLGLNPAIINNDYKTWPKIIKEILNNEDMINTLSENAHYFFHTHLNPLIIGKKYLSLFTEVLKNNKTWQSLPLHI